MLEVEIFMHTIGERELSHQWLTVQNCRKDSNPHFKIDHCINTFYLFKSPSKSSFLRYKTSAEKQETRHNTAALLFLVSASGSVPTTHSTHKFCYNLIGSDIHLPMFFQWQCNYFVFSRLMSEGTATLFTCSNKLSANISCWSRVDLLWTKTGWTNHQVASPLQYGSSHLYCLPSIRVGCLTGHEITFSLCEREGSTLPHVKSMATSKAILISMCMCVFNVIGVVPGPL